jgi:hypothetical protein
MSLDLSAGPQALALDRGKSMSPTWVISITTAAGCLTRSRHRVACSIRRPWSECTRFHHMWRGPIASPPAIAGSVEAMVDEVKGYVPGYRLEQDVQFERLPQGLKTTLFLEVQEPVARSARCSSPAHDRELTPLRLPRRPGRGAPRQPVLQPHR